MTYMQTLQAWLQTFPLWEDTPIHVEYLTGIPGEISLFPQGQEILSQREDVLGNRYLSCRCGFILYRVAVGQQDQRENAQWLLAFQDWVRQQNGAGLAPKFGDVPRDSRIRAEKGQLSVRKKSGCTVHAVMLTADFTKLYEVK